MKSLIFATFFLRYLKILVEELEKSTQKDSAQESILLIPGRLGK